MVIRNIFNIEQQIKKLKNCTQHPGEIEVTEFLIEKQADIEARDKDGSTPLISSSDFGN